MHFFIEIFYQPFLNLLVILYYLLKFIMGPAADMGIAVILFTIAIRILMLPLTISGDRSEKEKRELEDQVAEIKKNYSADPVTRDAYIKRLMRGNKRVVISSTINLIIQTGLALMLWRIFAKGLLGADFHLLYDFVPQPKEALNLVFLGRYDLTHPNPTLNVIQSLSIFILELEISLFSPFPVTRRDVMLTQFTLPIVSYLIFSQLPAGKKLFIITTLLFSIVYTTQKQIRFWWHNLQLKFNGPGKKKTVIEEKEIPETGEQEENEEE